MAHCGGIVTLCRAAGGELEQIQFRPGLVSVQTTERDPGCTQRISRAVNERIGIVYEFEHSCTGSPDFGMPEPIRIERSTGQVAIAGLLRPRALPTVERLAVFHHHRRQLPGDAVQRLRCSKRIVPGQHQDHMGRIQRILRRVYQGIPF